VATVLQAHRALPVRPACISPVSAPNRIPDTPQRYQILVSPLPQPYLFAKPQWCNTLRAGFYVSWITPNFVSMLSELDVFHQPGASGRMEIKTVCFRQKRIVGTMA
jgi:hypothetical protein